MFENQRYINKNMPAVTQEVDGSSPFGTANQKARRSAGFLFVRWCCDVCGQSAHKLPQAQK